MARNNREAALNLRSPAKGRKLCLIRWAQNAVHRRERRLHRREICVEPLSVRRTAERRLVRRWNLPRHDHVPVCVSEEWVLLDLLGVSWARSQSLRWVSRQEAVQDGDGVGRHVDRVQRLVFQDGVEDFILVVTAEGRLTQEHLVDEDTKGPPVDCPSVSLLEQDLWCHELGRSTEGASGVAIPHVLLAQTVVGDLDVTVQSEEDIVKLQVSVDDALLVEVLQSEQNLSSVELGSFRRELLFLDVQHQVTTADVLHDKVNACLGLEARMQTEEEGMALAGCCEEDAFLRLCALHLVVLDDEFLLQNFDGIEIA